MAFITISGEPGARIEELARAAAQRVGYELIDELRIDVLLAEEFAATIPDKAWPSAVTSIVARIGTEHDLVIAASGAEQILANVAGVLRVFLMARPAWRAGALMIREQVDRPAALELLEAAEMQERQTRKSRFGRTSPAAHQYDVVLNAESFEPESLADIVSAAVRARRIAEQGRLSSAAEAQIQFQARMRLARFGITPAGKAVLHKTAFGHPSEELFAHLLDFYRISWHYEPRSFPLQWDKDGKVIEAFTPDFYLPEFDLYVELTTMKQALVTKKNRKVKLLKAIYPHVNIRVFYQKDFQDLVFKHGLEGRLANAHGES
jgi:cytidylate kinase